MLASKDQTHQTAVRARWNPKTTYILIQPCTLEECIKMCTGDEFYGTRCSISNWEIIFFFNRKTKDLEIGMYARVCPEFCGCENLHDRVAADIFYYINFTKELSAENATD